MTKSRDILDVETKYQWHNWSCSLFSFLVSIKLSSFSRHRFFSSPTVQGSLRQSIPIPDCIIFLLKFGKQCGEMLRNLTFDEVTCSCRTTARSFSLRTILGIFFGNGGFSLLCLLIPTAAPFIITIKDGLLHSSLRPGRFFAPKRTRLRRVSIFYSICSFLVTEFHLPVCGSAVCSHVMMIMSWWNFWDRLQDTRCTGTVLTIENASFRCGAVARCRSTSYDLIVCCRLWPTVYLFDSLSQPFAFLRNYSITIIALCNNFWKALLFRPELAEL
jgi:hypothetical protein